jgi:hypothetical protein
LAAAVAAVLVKGRRAFASAFARSPLISGTLFYCYVQFYVPQMLRVLSQNGHLRVV